jgi:hypothetical protein
MRNCHNHLDLSDKKKKDTTKTDTASENLSSNNQGEDEGSDLIVITNQYNKNIKTNVPLAHVPQPVTVRFAKTGLDKEKQAKAREQSFVYQQQKAKEEQWVNLKVKFLVQYFSAASHQVQSIYFAVPQY